MKGLRILLLILMQPIWLLGQEQKVETEIKSENIYDLSIININPNLFPEISVIFQAKNKFHRPLWKLDESEILVYENGNPCEVLNVINISKNKPINIGLVFDHSGSMVDNPIQILNGYNTMQDYYFSGKPLPENYKMAIDYAKEGINGFLSGIHNSEDSILFVGFSDKVDKVLPLTNNTKKVLSFINQVEPSGSTSFYDALYLAIELLSDNTNKQVIVALTDGKDNMSKSSYQEVIKLANSIGVNIYVIGLGFVNEVPLQLLSNRTNGYYYHTNDPDMLKEIYLNIKDQIRSVYQVDYKSYSVDYLNEERNTKFEFVNDTLLFTNKSAFYSLTKETVEYLKEQEKKRRMQMIFGGLVILGIGSYMIHRRRKYRS